MDLTAMIEAATTQFKQKLITQCKNLDMTCLHPQMAQQVTTGLQEALQAAGTCALRTFLEAYEVDETPKVVNGITYRFKQGSMKTFLTAFGKMRLSRIASGPVEATCKTLVKTRLCRSGMQRTWHGGQRILQLRTYVKSKRWAPFWQAYKTHHFQHAEPNNSHGQEHLSAVRPVCPTGRQTPTL